MYKDQKIEKLAWKAAIRNLLLILWVQLILVIFFFFLGG